MANTDRKGMKRNATQSEVLIEEGDACKGTYTHSLDRAQALQTPEKQQCLAEAPNAVTIESWTVSQIKKEVVQSLNWRPKNALPLTGRVCVCHSWGKGDTEAHPPR